MARIVYNFLGLIFNALDVFKEFTLYLKEFTLYHYNYIGNLEKELLEAKQKIRDYHDSGAIEKVLITKRCYPDVTTGLKSLCVYTEWVPVEEAKKYEIINGVIK
jgi:hypothetical protein